jgi:hypothetical protein
VEVIPVEVILLEVILVEVILVEVQCQEAMLVLLMGAFLVEMPQWEVSQTRRLKVQ